MTGKYYITNDGFESGVLREREFFQSQSYLHMLPPESFEKDESTGLITVKANGRNNYHVSALYTSPCVIYSGHIEYSTYTKQLLEERAKQGMHYEYGVVFAGISKGIKINKKRSILLQNSILRELEGKYYQIFPTKNEIELYSHEINRLISNNLDINILIDHGQKFNFSIIGFVLFEIIHESLAEAGLTDYEIKHILQELDPSQKKLWSMRGFKLPRNFSSNLIKYKDLIYTNINKLKFAYLQEFLDNQNLDEISFNLLVHEKFNQVEVNNKLFSLDIERIIYSPDIDNRIKIIGLYNEFKSKIVGEVDGLLREQNIIRHIIVPYHKYSRDEFLIPLSSWEDSEVMLVQKIDKQIIPIENFKLHYTQSS